LLWKSAEPDEREMQIRCRLHKRSNIESTFSDERNFGDSIRRKTYTAMVNGVLCKVPCHNLVVLIYEMYELGVGPVFWKQAAIN
jgi:hypothetical protein